MDRKINIDILPKTGIVRSKLICEVLNIKSAHFLASMVEDKLLPKNHNDLKWVYWDVEEVYKKIKKIIEQKIYYNFYDKDLFLLDIYNAITEITKKQSTFISFDLKNYLMEKYKVDKKFEKRILIKTQFTLTTLYKNGFLNRDFSTDPSLLGKLSNYIYSLAEKAPLNINKN